MKSVLCDSPDCDKVREHHENPYELRARRSISVPDDYEGKAFCSIECACLAGYHRVSTGGWNENSPESNK